jgi:phage gp36-like protein
VAYTTQAQIANAAGGAAALDEIAAVDGGSTVDAGVLAQAQAEADAMIDSAARRLYGDLLPFDPVHPAIAALAAAEVVYILRAQKRVLSDADITRKTARDATIEALKRGEWNPITPDPYPLADGGGAPVVRVRSSSDVDAQGCVVPSRSSMRGFW